MNYENHMAALSPQPLAQQGQSSSSSSSPHPVSILSQPASRTFHNTPRTLLGLSQSRETLSLEPILSLLFLLLSRGSIAIFIPPPSLLCSPPPSVRPRLQPASNIAWASSSRPHWPLLDKGGKSLKSSFDPACQSWQEVTDRRPSRRASREAAPPEIPAPPPQLTEGTVVPFLVLWWHPLRNRPPSMNVYKAACSAEALYNPPRERYCEASSDIIRK